MAKEVTGDIYDPSAWDSVPPIEKGIGQLLKFESHGMVLVGVYQGIGTLDTDDGEARYHQFKDAMIVTPNGEAQRFDLISVSASFNLSQKLEEVSEGSPVRVEYVADQETSRGQTPMKVFQVKAKF